MDKQSEIILSVCLVTYNHAQFISQVIESVLMQKTNFAFELVIGEDHSSDNTRAICKTYQQQYPDIINLLPEEDNLGLKENFLRTFRSCKGKYIAYLEGDDYWLSENKLQSQVDILENNPDVSMVHTNCKVRNVATGEIIESLIPTDGVCIRETQSGIDSVIAEFEGNFRPMKTSSCCYRRCDLEAILNEDEFAFRCKDFPMQDFQLFLEMSMMGKFAFISEEMTMIGYHDSLSAAHDECRRANYNLGFYKAGIYYIKKFNLSQQTIQIWVRRQLHSLFNSGFKNHDTNLIKEAKALADSVGYQMPITQKIVYIGSLNPLLRLLIYPIWFFLNSYRNNK